MENETTATRNRQRHAMRSIPPVSSKGVGRIPNPNMSVEVKDFGPIARGKVDLRPLTVFAGPCNAGKSWLAMLFYAFGILPNTENRFSFPQRSFCQADVRNFAKLLSKAGIDRFPENINEWRQRSMNFQNVTLTESESEILRQLASQASDELGEEMLRCFGATHFGKLARNSGSVKYTASVAVKAGPIVHNLTIGDDSDSISMSVEFDSKLSLKSPKYEKFSADQRPQKRLTEILTGLGDDGQKGKHENAFSQYKIAAACLDALYSSRQVNATYFLPAYRSGIMHTHSAIINSLLRGAARNGIHQEPRISKYTGVVGDFMEHLVNLANQEHPNRALSDELSNELAASVLQGTVDVNSSISGFPIFTYRPAGWKEDMPLVNASSMVSEVGPVLLYLRYLVRPGDLLILEEPEAHLHPAFQKSFTQEVVRWVKCGIRVILTTHSEWVVDEISNIVARSRPKVEKIWRPDQQVLDSDDVGVWKLDLIDQERQEKGTEIVEVSWDEDERGYETGFYSVFTEQYNEWGHATDES